MLSYAEPARRAEIFRYFPPERQLEAFEQLDRGEISQLIDDLPADERVDILNDVAPEVAQELLPLVPADDRRDILRLQKHQEETAGAVMTSQFARLSEKLTADEALRELREQVQESETIYYLYVVDDEDHLRGLVSLKEVFFAPPETLISDLMTRDVIAVRDNEDQEEVARILARYDFLAIPVVDQSHHLLGIITHDDVIDVVRAEATEDAHQMGCDRSFGRKLPRCGDRDDRLETGCLADGLVLRRAANSRFPIRESSRIRSLGMVGAVFAPRDRHRWQHRRAIVHAGNHGARHGRLEKRRLVAGRAEGTINGPDIGLVPGPFGIRGGRLAWSGYVDRRRGCAGHHPVGDLVWDPIGCAVAAVVPTVGFGSRDHEHARNGVHHRRAGVVYLPASGRVAAVVESHGLLGRIVGPADVELQNLALDADRPDQDPDLVQREIFRRCGRKSFELFGHGSVLVRRGLQTDGDVLPGFGERLVGREVVDRVDGIGQQQTESCDVPRQRVRLEVLDTSGKVLGSWSAWLRPQQDVKWAKCPTL